MEYLTTKNVMAMLKLSRVGVYNLIQSGKLPRPILVGGKNLFRGDMIDAAIDRMAVEQGAGWASMMPPAAPASRAAQ